MTRIGVMVLVLLAGARTWGCSVCGCGDPLAAVGESSPVAGSLLVRLDAEHLTMRAGSDDEPGVTEHLTQRTLQPSIVWSPADGWSLLAQIPVVNKRMTASDEDGVREAEEHAGVGDATLAVRWFAWNQVDFRARRRSLVAFTAGSSLPTAGLHDEHGPDEPADQHGQLGTGGFGPMGGLSASRRGETWGATASVTAVARLKNHHGYRYGDAVRWSTRGEFAPGDRWMLMLAVDGRYADFDAAEGGTLPHTGGTVLALAPAAWLRVAPGAWLTAQAQVPVMTRLFGDQHVGPTFTVGGQYQLRGR